MISELLFHAVKSAHHSDVSSTYRAEYEHRCEKLNMTMDQKSRFLQYDKQAIETNSSYINPDAMLATTNYGNLTPNFIIPPTLSELVTYVNHEMANLLAKHTDVGTLSWEMMCQELFHRSNSMAARVLRHILYCDIGLDIRQLNRFISEEYSILRRTCFTPDVKNVA